MLIGLSISKCISDIMEGKVAYNDVLLIIGRTDFDLNTIDELIGQYQSYRGEWKDYNHDDLKDLIARMYKEGKIHQPRQFGAYPMPAGRGRHWLRTLYEPQDLPASAQKAWDHYVLIAAFN